MTVTPRAYRGRVLRGVGAFGVGGYFDVNDPTHESLGPTWAVHSARTRYRPFAFGPSPKPTNAAGSPRPVTCCHCHGSRCWISVRALYLFGAFTQYRAAHWTEAPSGRRVHVHSWGTVAA